MKTIITEEMRLRQRAIEYAKKYVNCNIYLPFFSKKSACLLKIDLLTSTQVFS